MTQTLLGCPQSLYATLGRARFSSGLCSGVHSHSTLRSALFGSPRAFARVSIISLGYARPCSALSGLCSGVHNHSRLRSAVLGSLGPRAKRIIGYKFPWLKNDSQQPINKSLSDAFPSADGSWELRPLAGLLVGAPSRATSGARLLVGY